MSKSFLGGGLGEFEEVFGSRAEGALIKSVFFFFYKEFETGVGDGFAEAIDI